MNSADATLRPQDFPPAPRDIRRKTAPGCTLTGIRLFILPHMCVGVGMLLFLAWELSVLLFGTSSTGNVTGRHTKPSSKGGPTRFIDYAYGNRIADHQQVAFNDYQRLATGSPVKVRSLTIAGHSFSLLIDPLAPTLRDIGFLAFFSCFWNGVVCIFVWTLYVLPWRRKWLARNGEPVVGRVTSKVSLPGKNGKTYSVKYDYASSDGLARSGEMPIEPIAYEETREGQNVIVLYDPMKPNHSVVYEFGEYGVNTRNSVLLGR